MIGGRGFGAVGNSGAEVVQEAVFQAIDPTVNGELLAAFPGVSGDGGVAHVGDLFDDVEFAEALDCGEFVIEFGEKVTVFVADGLDMA